MNAKSQSMRFVMGVMTEVMETRKQRQAADEDMSMDIDPDAPLIVQVGGDPRGPPGAGQFRIQPDRDVGEIVIRGRCGAGVAGMDFPDQPRPRTAVSGTR